jgi:hypothetical protein
MRLFTLGLFASLACAQTMPEFGRSIHRQVDRLLTKPLRSLYFFLRTGRFPTGYHFV